MSAHKWREMSKSGGGKALALVPAVLFFAIYLNVSHCHIEVSKGGEEVP